MITDLGKVSALRVISHTSVMQYRDTKKSLPEIARELDVDVLVEGTVARSGDRVRITANLVQASPEKHLWADSYERNLGDILMLQDDVARAIADGIQIKLTPHEQARLESARTVNPEAYEAYIEGRYFLDLSRWEQGGQEKAAGDFQRATELDPSWGLPYSGLADSYLFMGINDVIPNEDCPTKAQAAALEAVKGVAPLPKPIARWRQSNSGAIGIGRNPSAPLCVRLSSIPVCPKLAACTGIGCWLSAELTRDSLK